MQPLNFEGANVVFAANQPEYIPLPAEYRGGKSGEILTCWELTQEELQRIQETGKIWLGVLTFGQPLQPLLLSVEKPEPYDE